MPLMQPLLAIDIKNAFDEVEKIGIADPSRDLHWELGKRLATAIDKYIKMGIVQVNTDTPNIVIMPVLPCGVATILSIIASIPAF